MKKKILIIIATVAFLAAGTEAVLGYYNKQDFNYKDNKTKSTATSNAKTTNTVEKAKNEQNNTLLKEKDIQENSKKVVQAKDYSKLTNDIKAYCADKKGTYGVYFKSLTSGQEFGINDTDEYVAASTVKLPVNLYLFSKYVTGEIKPDDKMQYAKGDYEEGCGDIQYGKVGSNYTLRQLSSLSIQISDNVAVNMLIRHLGRENICAFREKIVGHQVYRDKNIASPKDMGMYLDYLMNFSKTHPKEGEELLNYLKNTDQNDRIPVYIPKGVPVAHKIGNQIGAVHDVGIVFAEKPFIISVMSKDANEGQANEVIAKIAKMVYDFEQK